MSWGPVRCSFLSSLSLSQSLSFVGPNNRVHSAGNNFRAVTVNANTIYTVYYRAVPEIGARVYTRANMWFDATNISENAVVMRAGVLLIHQYELRDATWCLTLVDSVVVHIKEFRGFDNDFLHLS